MRWGRYFPSSESMKLNLPSFNVRGLNDDAVVSTMRSYLTDCRPSLDIFILQEHKTRGTALLSLDERLWQHATAFYIEATAGYGHTPRDPGEGCSGILTLLHPRWASRIGVTCTLLGNRFHWFTLTGLRGGDIGFASIYAPNGSYGRCLLWEAMAQSLPFKCRWLLLGDFNMVESRGDKTQPTTTMIPQRERLLFASIKDAFQVKDNPRSLLSQRFFWNNNRPGEGRSVSWLELIYLFHRTLGESHRSLLDYRIKGNVTRSDHLPVIATLQLAHQTTRQSYWKMNVSWIDDAAPAITRIWQEADLSLSFFAKMRLPTCFYGGFCKHKARGYKLDEDGLLQDLDAATWLAQASPTDEAALAHFATCRTTLENQARKLAGKTIRNRVIWKAKGDLVSMEFFRAVQDRSAASSISALRNLQGNRLTDRPNLEQQALEFYQNLYAPIPAHPLHAQLKRRLLDITPPTFQSRFTTDVLARLGYVPDKQEVRPALYALPSRALGQTRWS